MWKSEKGSQISNAVSICLVMNLEAEEVAPMLCRRIAERVAALEEAITDHLTRRRDLVERSVDEAPVPADIVPPLDRPPLPADRCGGLDARVLRALVDIVQLDVAFLPADEAIDVNVTLSDHWQSSVLSGTSEDRPAPPGQ